MEITVYGKVDETQFLRFVDLAAKYCSIHETISKVATMTHKVHFVDFEFMESNPQTIPV